MPGGSKWTVRKIRARTDLAKVEGVAGRARRSSGLHVLYRCRGRVWTPEDAGLTVRTSCFQEAGTRNSQSPSGRTPTRIGGNLVLTEGNGGGILQTTPSSQNTPYSALGISKRKQHVYACVALCILYAVRDLIITCHLGCEVM